MVLATRKGFEGMGSCPFGFIVMKLGNDFVENEKDSSSDEEDEEDKVRLCFFVVAIFKFYLIRHTCSPPATECQQGQ